MEGPIDIVYLWVDGTDPEWVAKRNRAMESKGMVYDRASESNGDRRYVQFDELKYSLRSLEMFVPWINHIFIVTDGQRPEWLRDHPKITIVDHKDIIPSEYLPTFSSVTIEMFLERIPGLSERFIFANDDCFFNKPLQPGDFFQGEKPIVWFERYKKFALNLDYGSAVKILNDDAVKMWGKTIVKAWVTFLEKNGLKDKDFPFLGPIHSFEPYNLNYLRNIIKKYPELMTENTKQFRDHSEIMHVIFQYEFVHTYGCTKKVNPLRTRFSRLLAHFYKKEMFNIYQVSPSGLSRRLELFSPKAFCLNSVKRKELRSMKDLLEKRFPIVLPWEANLE